MTVGGLGPGDSFGECTVLRDEAITYSIVTATNVQLGIISQDEFDGEFCQWSSYRASKLLCKLYQVFIKCLLCLFLHSLRG